MEATIPRPLSKLISSAATPCWQNAATRRRYSGLAALAGIVAVLSISPALPQAGVALVKVDLSVVAQGYRMSKLIGSTVINDKNEKIGSLDDLIAAKIRNNSTSRFYRSAASSAQAAIWSQSRLKASSSTIPAARSLSPAHPKKS